MWKRSYINNFSNLDTSSVNSSDSRLTSVSRTLYISFNLSQAKIKRYFSAILCSHLCCVGSVLL